MEEPKPSNRHGTLTSQEVRSLRSKAMSLKPQLSVGKEGVTPEVAKQLASLLDQTPLVKIRILDPDRRERQRMAEALTSAAHGQIVGQVGKTFAIYRRPKEESQ